MSNRQGATNGVTTGFKWPREGWFSGPSGLLGEVFGGGPHCWLREGGLTAPGAAFWGRGGFDSIRDLV